MGRFANLGGGGYVATMGKAADTDQVRSAGKRRGPAKGQRFGGRKKGTPNKKTVERLKARAAELALERLKREASAQDRSDKAEAGSTKLMVEIGFDMTKRVTALAIFYAPSEKWHVDQRTRKLVNDNPHFDEAKFRYYIGLSMQGARDFASYETPKLQAILLQANTNAEIVMSGGLPDELDGNLTKQVTYGPAAERDKPAASGPTIEHSASDIPPQPSGGVQASGPVQGDPVRQKVG